MKKRIADMQTANSETAEKLISLFDEESFTELDKFVSSDAKTCSVVSGYGNTDGQTVYAYAQDMSVRSGALDESAAAKIKKIYKLALKNGAPVVSILASNGGDIAQGVKMLNAYGEITRMSATLSGVVPQISIIDGVCAGAAATVACLSDIVIMTEKAELFMTAPFIAEDKTAGAGTAANAAKSGVAAIIVKDLDEAIAKAKKLISILPANNLEIAGNDYFINNDTDITEAMTGTELIDAVADKDSVIELYKEFGSAATVALGSLNWRTAGFVATDKAARLSKEDCAKISRFVTLCDAFSIPVITIVDTEGYEKSTADELAGSIRDTAKLAQSYASATTPKISVIKGKAYGAAYIALSSISAGNDFSFAWETAEISPASPKACAAFLTGNDDASSVAEYTDNEASPFTAASYGYVDKVIEAEDTRAVLVSAMEALSSKRVQSPARKHVNFVF